jgi:anti-anti-sigma factor
MLDFSVVVGGTPETVVISGEIDVATGPQVAAVLAGCDGDIRIDCAAVTFVDSAGFRTFDRAYDAATKRGSYFVIADLPAFPSRIADILGLPYASQMTGRSVS